VKAKEL